MVAVWLRCTAETTNRNGRFVPVLLRCVVQHNVGGVTGTPTTYISFSCTNYIHLLTEV